MDVKVVSKRMVKPCTPTPQNLRNYKISFMDELNPTMNVLGIYYYQSPAATKAQLQRMEESLSEILPSFYPFAGRYMKRERLVDCSDQGALVVEAIVDLELEEVIKPDSKLEVEDLNDLLPCEIGAADEETDPILRVQFNRFKCGGLAIGITISHRVVDACSLGVFLAAWTNIATRGRKGEPIYPNFDGPLFFPGRDFPEPEFGMTRARENGLFSIICKRFLIDTDAISRLKAKQAGRSDGPRSVLGWRPSGGAGRQHQGEDSAGTVETFVRESGGPGNHRALCPGDKGDDT